MNLNRAVFVASAVKGSQYPIHSLPEIALVGRSNVGKSSLINSLCNRKGLARTSSSPGRTQTINFYLVDDSFYLVDLPGYGFAKVPQRVKEKWGLMIESYLKERPNLVGVIMILDARHEPTAHDRKMLQWLRVYEKPTVTVATKSDKVKSSQRVKTFRELQNIVGRVIVYSSLTGEGKEELVRELSSLIKGEE